MRILTHILHSRRKTRRNQKLVKSRRLKSNFYMIYCFWVLVYVFVSFLLLHTLPITNLEPGRVCSFVKSIMSGRLLSKRVNDSVLVSSVFWTLRSGGSFRGTFLLLRRLMSRSTSMVPSLTHALTHPSEGARENGLGKWFVNCC